MRQCLIALVVLVLGGLLGLQAQDRPVPRFKLNEDEQTLLDLVNKSRAKEKLTPLEPNETLTKVARAHSANMAKQEKMAHVLDGKKPAQRVDEAGYDYRFVGENVATSEGEDVTLGDIHESWMKSKVHRDNILKKEYRQVGLGVARNGKGQVYYTQVFGTLRKQR